MSAWIVTQAHIDVLVQAGIVAGLVDLRSDSPDEVGSMLWDENHAQVNYRYGEQTPTPDYTFSGIEAPLDPIVVCKAIACIEYQCWEDTDRWERSEAKRYCDLLLARLHAAHGQGAFDPDNPDSWARDQRAYDRAPWGIDSIEQAIPATFTTTTKEPR